MKRIGLKKNTFIQGTLIASASIIFIKVLGALYVIPFYKIIGESGGTLYSYAYNIYNLFLNVSTAGIPIAMSMIISEYLALNMYDAKERSFKVGKKLISILAIISFLLVFFGAPYLAKFILSDVTGGHSISEVALVIRAISPCLLIIPFLSILRGYLQGHKFIAPTSYSQIIEQVVRVLFLIFGSYIAIKIFKTNTSLGVSIALLGTFLGGLAAYMYLRNKVRHNKKEFPVAETKDPVKNKILVKKILTYCIPIVLIAVTDSIYTLVDIKLIIKGLNIVGYTAMESEILSGIVATWAPKICAIIIAIALALTTNVIPHVTSNFIKKDMKAVNYRINQAISTMLMITIPMTIILFLMSNEAYFLFYGQSNYGGLVLKASAISHLILGLWSVTNSSLQSMKKFKEIYKNSITGLVLNAVLDIPLILLFNKIGISPYIATIVSSCIGYGTSFIMSLLYMKRNMEFNYKNTISTLKKLVVPCICIIVPILLVKHFINYELSYKSSFISLAISGLFGVITYLFITYKNGALESTFGNEYINKILAKLHLKKENN